MKSIFLILGLILSTQLWAQEYLQREHIGMQDGLSYRHVKSFIKDSEGFLWVSSFGGIDRYDGVDWLHFKSLTSDSSIVPVDDVRWMFEDPSGSLILELGLKGSSKYFLFNKKEETLQKIIFQNSKQEKIDGSIDKPFSSISGDIFAIGNVEGTKERFKFIYNGNGIFEAISAITLISPPFDSLTTTTSKEIHWTKLRISHRVYAYSVFEVDYSTQLKIGQR